MRDKVELVTMEMLGPSRLLWLRTWLFACGSISGVHAYFTRAYSWFLFCGPCWILCAGSIWLALRIALSEATTRALWTVRGPTSLIATHLRAVACLVVGVALTWMGVFGESAAFD